MKPVPFSVGHVSLEPDTARFSGGAGCTNSSLIYSLEHAVAAEPGFELVPVYLDESKTALLVSSTAGTADPGHEVWRITT